MHKRRLRSVGILLLLVLAFGLLRAGRSWFVLPRFAPPTPVVPSTGTSLWCYDERLGFSHVPSVYGTHRAHDFQVRYTIDEHGWRVTPDPIDPVGRIVIAGCSFTFGDGVEDTECFPYVLANEHWPQYKVCNRASMAYGTGQAYLILEEELASQQPPLLFLYGYISGHVQRNYLDKYWLNLLANPEDKSQRRGNPHFEVEGGRPVFKGMADPATALPPGEELTSKSIETTIALIVEMDRMAKAKKVPFVLVVLPTKADDPLDAEVLPHVSERGVPIVDLRHLCGHHDYIPNDGHPGAPCHVKIASSIAESKEAVRALGR